MPFRLLAATGKDQYRKPMPGMWHEIERIFKEEGVQIGDSGVFRQHRVVLINSTQTKQNHSSSAMLPAASIRNQKQILQAQTASGLKM